MNKFAAAKAATTGNSAPNLKREVAVVGTLAYPSISEPDENGKYSTLLIVDPKEETLHELIELVEDHAEALTGKRQLTGRHFDPIRDGDEPSKSGEGFAFKHPAFRGKTVVRLKSNFAPKTVHGPRREPIAATEIHGGDEVAVGVSAYSYNNQSSGVALSLGAIWLTRPGDERIERGGAVGSSFGKIDASRLRFVNPRDLPRSGGDEDDLA